MIPKNENPFENVCRKCYKSLYNDYRSTAIDLCSCRPNTQTESRRTIWDLFFIEYPEYLEMIEKHKNASKL